MTAQREYEGKSLDLAIEKACDALGITKEELDYEVISHGSSGIFGLAGVKKAKIRVNLPEARTQASSLLDRLDHELSCSQTTATSRREPHPVDIPPVFLSGEDSRTRGYDVLKRIVKTISSDAEVTVDANSERLLFAVQGGDPALLIGKRGQTLEAIQTLVEKVVNKQNADNGKIRVLVDVAGYLQTRQANLEKLANKLATKSKRIGKPIVLSQMNAYERRVIHLALKNDPGVRTKSRGEGYLRKLVIFPKKTITQ